MQSFRPFSIALAIAPFIACAQSMQHDKGVDTRGDQAMGFSHEKTRHHFRLFKDGGSIDIVVKDRRDKQQVGAIRSHLKMVSGMFARGDFHLPMFIHDRTVPGQRTMERLKSHISYRYEEISLGARVRIRSADSHAVSAIHSFLKFQIKDHRTGDSGRIEK